MLANASDGAKQIAAAEHRNAVPATIIFMKAPSSISDSIGMKWPEKM
jgi:hypothetical protein